MKSYKADGFRFSLRYIIKNPPSAIGQRGIILSWIILNCIDFLPAFTTNTVAFECREFMHAVTKDTCRLVFLQDNSSILNIDFKGILLFYFEFYS